MLRTHNIGEVNEELEGKTITLCGWVDTLREHGKVVFIDLRDRYAKIQTVMTAKHEQFEEAKKISKESCILIQGIVNKRPKGTENKDLSTGGVEVKIEKLEIFNSCPRLPFEINEKDVNEEVRLKYRFLDLRSQRMQKNIILRSKTLKAVRDYFYEKGFIEIETPIMAKSTPEGARDYVVPSRNFPAKFYALPQSPQLFKQLSQIAGFDRYIQIARCFRDEDSRSDRQPEFTQIDIEMSFIEPEDIMNLIEGMLKHTFKEVLNKDIKPPFKKITYNEAMKKYRNDRPDLRKETGEELAFCWVIDFPLFEYDEGEKRYKSTHHPFTMPEMDSFNKDPGKAKSLAYDCVLNGVEIGGGSIRIHNPQIQEKIFEILKISKKEAQEKFGFLLEALSFGAPAHGGIAFGFDRMIQIMTGEDSIREVIAFPKNKEARDVMLDAPSEISEKQLKEIHIKTEKPKLKKKKQ